VQHGLPLAIQGALRLGNGHSPVDKLSESIRKTDRGFFRVYMAFR
jgi:hypothetical protein